MFFDRARSKEALINQFGLPPLGHLVYFTNLSGNLATVDDGGVENIIAEFNGDPLTEDEQGSPPSAEVDKLKLYAKEVSGELEQFIRKASDDGSAEIQVTSGGGIKAGHFYDAPDGHAQAAFTHAGAADEVIVSIPIPTGNNKICHIEMLLQGSSDGLGPSVGVLRVSVSALRFDNGVLQDANFDSYGNTGLPAGIDAIQANGDNLDVVLCSGLAIEGLLVWTLKCLDLPTFVISEGA